MAQFVDRRNLSKNKSAVNRERFMRRFKKQIQEAVANAVNKRSITNIEQGEKVTIPAKNLDEPSFHFGQGGSYESIHAGNQDFTKGDKIKRPPTQAGEQGSQASQDGEGTDNFVFELSRKEFLDLFFEDLELPNLVKTQITKVPAYKYVRAGFTSYGNPSNINIVRSMRSAIGRRMAFANPAKAEIKELQQRLELEQDKTPQDMQLIQELQDQIKHLQEYIKNIPFIDPFDIRYTNKVKQVEPATQAVMFCLMDVSGSMDEVKKEAAKKFYILLYLFLTKTYENVELVFIRHHTSAKEVNEEEFFYSRETGGTVVSSALELMRDIMQQRYPSTEWNIYAAQASDGDNWNNDSPKCAQILQEDILPYLQFFAYVEILPRHHQSLWSAYQNVKQAYDNFSMQLIQHDRDIYPVFRELFKREVA